MPRIICQFNRLNPAKYHSPPPTHQTPEKRASVTSSSASSPKTVRRSQRRGWMSRGKTRRTVFGLLALLLVTLALFSGVWWVGGGEWYFAGFNLLNWHIILGIVLTAVILFHMFARAKRLRKRDVVGRRRMLYLSILLLGGTALWPGQQLTERALNLPGARRRFTGSREAGSYAGNAFPTSSWVADAPRPIDAQTWRLSLVGAVTKPRDFSYAELVAAQDQEEATLD